MKARACFVLVLLVPTASAAVEEFAPEGWVGPTHLAFDDEGILWVTVEGSWALGRYDPANNDSSLFLLPVPKDAQSSIGGIDVAPDGTVWLGTPRHLLHFFPGNESFISYVLPGTSIVSGDVHVAPDGIVWYAATSVDLLVRLDPADGSMGTAPLPEKPFGPLEFLPTDDGGFYLTGTYANTYAKYDPKAGGIVIGSAVVLGPVGIDDDAGGGLWIAEMGASSVSRVEPSSQRLQRYPTSHSPYYPASGPAGIYVDPQGIVWFIEHFADRVSRLDPQARTLHEYEMPSAPGSNVQFLAPASDGSIWLAQYSTNLLGRATFTNEPVPELGPASIDVPQGGRVEFELGDVSGKQLVAAGPDASLNASIVNGKLVVTATPTAVITRTGDGGALGTPEPFIMVGINEGTYVTSRLIPVNIVPAAKDAPMAPIVLLIGALALVALTRRPR